MIERRWRIILSIALLATSLACRRGPAEVRMVVSDSTGGLHAIKLAQSGAATVGNRTYVAISRGKPPILGQVVNIEDICYVFTAYRAGPWKMVWESPTRIGLALEGPLSRDYEEMIEQQTCDGVESRWFYEKKPSNP